MTTTPAVQHSRPDLVETVLTVLVGVTWSALPDHVASPSRRRAIRAALLAGGAGVVAVRSAGRPARDTPTVDDTVPDAGSSTRTFCGGQALFKRKNGLIRLPASSRCRSEGQA